jgi:hypothetical protein
LSAVPLHPSAEAAAVAAEYIFILPEIIFLRELSLSLSFSLSLYVSSSRVAVPSSYNTLSRPSPQDEKDKYLWGGADEDGRRRR